jgi:transposase
MKRTQYTAEFKTEAVKKILEKGHPATEVSIRLGVPVGLLYTWARKARGFSEEPPPDDLKALQAEMTKLKPELRRTTEERDILKKAAAYFAKVSE